MLLELLGNTGELQRCMTLGELLRKAPAASEPLTLTQTRLKRAGGVERSVLVSQRPLEAPKGAVLWLAFETQASRTKSVAWMRQLAHELNNPLTSVLWKLDLVARQLPRVASEPSRLAELSRHLDEAHFGTSRAVELVREFTRSVHDTETALEALDLSCVVKDSIYLVKSEIELVATLVEDFSAVPAVLGHRSMLQQVFSNLLLNALQAVREASLPQDHRIRVELRAEGCWVVASVEDTGVGISEAQQSRVFEPFVTTRAESGGSGLGLFISRQIVEALGGRLELSSSQLSGSSFRVWLKRAGAPQSPDGSSQPPSLRRARRR
jgi:signal transduction histidine kinase